MRTVLVVACLALLLSGCACIGHRKAGGEVLYELRAIRGELEKINEKLEAPPSVPATEIVEPKPAD